jgi:hypothetical protein
MNRYPWPEMQVGEVREITSDKPINVIRSAASMYSLKQQKKTGDRPKFKVNLIHKTPNPDWYYRAERTA